MKTTLTLLMSCALSVCAQDTTNKVDERRNPDGTMRWRVETTTRGKTPILYVRQTFTAGKTITTRSYLVAGEVVTVETDEDVDGIFETTIVYHPSQRDLEAFTRDPDGSVVPASAKTLAAYKKRHAAMHERETEFEKKLRPR
jgi:hypothetical protein